VAVPEKVKIDPNQMIKNIQWVLHYVTFFVAFDYDAICSMKFLTSTTNVAQAVNIFMLTTHIFSRG
jgi:hypothetical protein